MIVFILGMIGLLKGMVYMYVGFLLKILYDCVYYFELCFGDCWLWLSDMGWIVGLFMMIGVFVCGVILVCYDGVFDYLDVGCLVEVVDCY